MPTAVHIHTVVAFITVVVDGGRRLKAINQSINQSIISLLTYDKTHMLTLNTELQYKKS